MQPTNQRPLLAGLLTIGLLGAAQLAGGWLAYVQAPRLPAADTALPVTARLEAVTRSVVTVYAERSVSLPVMMMSDIAGEEAPNTEQDRGGWSWRSGSGFAVAAGGYVLTNNHVIADARRIEARLANGRRVRAELIGSDPLTDLAVLRIDAELPVLGWGDDEALRVGAPVMAIGSPLDFHQSVSSGVVGGFARAYDGADPVGYIQHDAALNPGNSGGPLIDAGGRVVGVNTAIPQEAFFNVGISLAVPASLARRVADSLIERGRVERGYLGVSVRALHGPLASAMGRRNGGGVLIESVAEGSPAEEAGIRVGQMLLAVNGIDLSMPRDLARALLFTRPGDVVALSLHDGQARFRVETMLDRREDDGFLPASRDLGFEPGNRHGYGLSFVAGGTSGVAVASVAPGSPAALAGMRAGDSVLAIGSVDLADPQEAELRLMLARSEVALRVLRTGEISPRYIALVLEGGTATRAPDHAAFADASGGPF